MIAMRRILDNPKRAWRNVSGVGLAVFIAVITSIGTLVGQDRGGDPLDPSMLYMRDIAEYRMLRLEGTDERTLSKARFKEVFTPLNTVVLVSGGGSVLLLFPIVAMTLFDPVTLFSLFSGIALCYVLIAVGAWTANRAARTLNTVGYRADD